MNDFKNKIPTTILRIVAILSAVAGVSVCVFGLPSVGAEIARIHPACAFWQYPITAGFYLAAGCFFFVLFHFWRLLDGVDRTGTLRAKNLKMIRLGAVAFAALYFVVAMPLLGLAVAAETEDSNPGILFIAAFAGTFPIAVAAVAAILERIAGGEK